MCAVLLAGSATGGTIQYNASRKNKTVEVATTPDSPGTLPRYILDSPDYALGGYQPAGSDVPSVSPATDRSSFYVRAPEDAFFIMRSAAGEHGQQSTAGRTVSVGTGTGVLRQIRGQWSIDARLSRSAVTAYGYGTIAEATLDALSRLRLDDEQLDLASFPSSYRVIPVENVDRVFLTYMPAKSGPFPLMLLVQETESYFDDLLRNARPVSRGERRYFVTELRGDGPEEIRTNVVWRLDESTAIRISASGPSATVLDLADAVRLATPDEWELVEAAAPLIAEPRDTTKDTLLSGTLDDGTPWDLSSKSRPKNATCHTVQLNSGSIDEGECVPDSATGPIRFASVATIAGQPIVFGITSRTSEDSNVVRVLDASGNEVGQDTTTDQDALDGRAFAIPLDADATGPFTVEVYDFDRDWYVSTYDDRDADLPYIKPGSQPLASTVVDRAP